MLSQVSEALGRFQTRLSEGKPAQITPELTHSVIGSIKYIEDLSASSMARMSDVDRSTAARYVREEITPPLSRFVRMMDKLGFEIYIIKKPHNDSPE